MGPKSPPMGLLRAHFCLCFCGGWLFLAATSAAAESYLPWIKPEQKQICIRHPSQLPHYALPETPAPPTVKAPQWDVPEEQIGLDDAIRVTLSNSAIVRILGGVAASSSGRSIYDAAISNAGIDVAQGVFDPQVTANNSWSRFERPFAFLDPDPPMMDTLLGVSQSSTYNLDFLLSKQNLAGGLWSFGITDQAFRVPQSSGPLLNPQVDSTFSLSYEQPLLNGAGRAANQVPIVLARIDTERSYFQFKSSVQQMVRDVIDAYWSLVAARTELWARQQQVNQAEFALAQAQNRALVGDISEGEVAQPKLALASFKSTLIAAKANVLQREAALRSILGLPPQAPQRITPVTPPTDEELNFDWQSLLSMAEQYRPDIIELKLIIEADQQRLLQSRNFAQPQLNAFGLYRWNGLEGVMPAGGRVSLPLSDATDWTLGVNFSVPLGLRSGRAQFRQQELLIARDRANLTQGLQTATYLLAANLRNLDQFYEQYQATRETRQAARENLEYQMARYRNELLQFINVLQAIVSWGDSVSSEAQLLAQYNIEQANLELQTGTILESHGVFFFEERYRSLGPLCCLGDGQCYPRAKRPTDNADIYPVGDTPSEEHFDLSDPLSNVHDARRKDSELLPEFVPLPPSEPIEPYQSEPLKLPELPEPIAPVP